MIIIHFMETVTLFSMIFNYGTSSVSISKIINSENEETLDTMRNLVTSSIENNAAKLNNVNAVTPGYGYLRNNQIDGTKYISKTFANSTTAYNNTRAVKERAPRNRIPDEFSNKTQQPEFFTTNKTSSDEKQHPRRNNTLGDDYRVSSGSETHQFPPNVSNQNVNNSFYYYLSKTDRFIGENTSVHNKIGDRTSGKFRENEIRLCTGHTCFYSNVEDETRVRNTRRTLANHAADNTTLQLGVEQIEHVEENAEVDGDKIINGNLTESHDVARRMEGNIAVITHDEITNTITSIGNNQTDGENREDYAMFFAKRQRFVEGSSGKMSTNSMENVTRFPNLYQTPGTSRIGTRNSGETTLTTAPYRTFKIRSNHDSPGYDAASFANDQSLPDDQFAQEEFASHLNAPSKSRAAVEDEDEDELPVLQTPLLVMPGNETALNHANDNGKLISASIERSQPAMVVISSSSMVHPSVSISSEATTGIDITTSPEDISPAKNGTPQGSKNRTVSNLSGSATCSRNSFSLIERVTS